MKKTILTVLAVMALVAFLATDCDKPGKTREQLLTEQTKGWVLSTATCYPPYQLNNGGSTENLLNGFFYECEKDDIIIFKENKSLILNYGKVLCEGETGKEEALGLWALLKDNEVLRFYLSAYRDDNNEAVPLEAKIVTLDEKNPDLMVLRVPIEEDDMQGPAKNSFRGVRGSKTIRNYEFTLTYTKAK